MTFRRGGPAANKTIFLPQNYRSLGQLSTDFNMKWRSLFHDWESNVFGSTMGLSNKQIWNKVAIYTYNSKRKEKMKLEEFSHENVSFCDARRDSLDKFDRSSLKSNNSVYSQYSLRSNRELHTKLLNFNENVDLIKEKTNSLKSERVLSQSETCSNREVLFNNLNLQEIFMIKQSPSQNGLNKITYEYTGDIDKRRRSTAGGSLDYIPCFGITQLEQSDLVSIKDYLTDAFKDPHHPLGVLNSKISFCFYTSYGCWKVKPTSILSSQAMREWEMISKRIYNFIRKLFPALPVESDNCDG